MTNLNKEFLDSLYEDPLKKKIIDVMSDITLSDEQKVELLVKLMHSGGLQ